jgi:hypothetical protein
LGAGTYYIPVLGADYYGNNTPGPYEITFTSVDAPPQPPNDSCSGAVPVILTSGIPVTEFGDWTGAIPDCGYYTYPTVWHACTVTDSCNNLTISYCGSSISGPYGNGGQGNSWIIINPTCPITCYGDIFSSSYENTSCGDGNWSIYYYGLLPGTYYIPVMGEYPGYNVGGAYSITMSVDNCPTDYICGIIFEDLNSNGVQDTGEFGIANQSISWGLYSTITNGQGSYFLPANTGVNDLCVNVPAGFVSSLLNWVRLYKTVMIPFQ